MNWQTNWHAFVNKNNEFVSEEMGASFFGESTQPNHFKLLEIDGDNLLVGARFVLSCEYDNRFTKDCTGR